MNVTKDHRLAIDFLIGAISKMGAENPAQQVGSLDFAKLREHVEETISKIEIHPVKLEPGAVISGEDRRQVQAVDLINEPPHYLQHPSGVECITIAEHFPFNIGSAIKYLWRADHKGHQMEDLKKARWYVDREIARLLALFRK